MIYPKKGAPLYSDFIFATNIDHNFDDNHPIIRRFMVD